MQYFNDQRIDTCLKRQLAQGIPVHRGFFIEDIAEFELEPPALKGGRGPSINLDGAGVVYGVASVADVSECGGRMIASGLFDRYPNSWVVIRSSGEGPPLLLNRLFRKHQGPRGERRHSEILLEPFLIDTAGVSPCALPFILKMTGEERIVFGFDDAGDLGPLGKALPGPLEQPDPARVGRVTERNSPGLLRL